MSTPGTSKRKAEHAIEKFFVDRWSPRSLLPDAISKDDLAVMFEAARWAPSSYNNQPWRILYARNGSEQWPLFYNLLVEQNQAWAKNAAVLVLIISNKKFDHNGKESPTHSFDAGAAWQNLALQAWLKGYVAHGMQGFDYARAQKDLEIPEDFQVEAMVALGREGPKEALPEPMQKMETPNDRRPLSGTVAEGKFTSKLLHAEKR
jgi:nitroreductase